MARFRSPATVEPLHNGHHHLGDRKVAVEERCPLWGCRGVIRHLYFSGVQRFLSLKGACCRKISKDIDKTETKQEQKPTTRLTDRFLKPFLIKMGFCIHRLSVVE